MRSIIVLVLLVFVGGCDEPLGWILFERVVVTSGEFKGLHIGMHRDDVLSQLQKLGVYAVRPAPVAEFRITKRNADDLDRLRHVDGVRVSGANGMAIDIFLRDAKVWLVRKSVPAKDNQWFAEGMEIAALIPKMREVIKTSPDMEIVPTVFYEGNGWIEITKSLDLARRALAPYGAWNFEISSDKPAGAFAKVLFVDAKLSKIEYRRPRIRVN